jgi:hypothetical protein
MPILIAAIDGEKVRDVESEQSRNRKCGMPKRRFQPSEDSLSDLGVQFRSRGRGHGLAEVAMLLRGFQDEGGTVQSTAGDYQCRALQAHVV